MTKPAAPLRSLCTLVSFLALLATTAPPAHAGVIAASRVSPSYIATTGGGNSLPYAGSLSGDGRWVLFVSSAHNLMAGQIQTGLTYQCYLHDRWNGTTLLVTRSASNPAKAANAQTSNCKLSRDGRYVVFLSSATNLVPGQTGSVGNQLFLYDRVTDSTILVSHQASSAVTGSNGTTTSFGIATSGVLVFSSNATNLISGLTDSNFAADAFVYDPATGTTTLVSRSAASPTTTANKAATDVSISADGNVVSYLSNATNLVTGQVDTNNAADLFGFDRAAGTTFLISHTTAGPTTTPAKASYKAVLSADGSYAFFTSLVSTGFVAGQTDTNNSADAFLFERSTGNISLVSHTAFSLVTAGNSSVTTSSLSIDDAGAKMTYLTYSRLHTLDTDSTTDVYLYYRLNQFNGLIAYNSGSPSDLPAISADGDLVVFKKAYPVSTWVAGVSDANATSDIMLYDTSSGQYDVASRSAAFVSTAGDASDAPQVSADGSTVVFSSLATDFESPTGDWNGWSDVMSYDRMSPSTQLLSHCDSGLTSGTAGGPNQLLTRWALSGDGSRAVFYHKSLNLLAPSAGFISSQLYLFDAPSSAVYMLNHKNGLPATPSTGYPAGAAISRDGGTVLFASSGTDHTSGITDTNGHYDLFSWDPATGNLAYLVLAAGSSTTAPNSGSLYPSLSSNGRYVAFQSTATNLISGLTDANSATDIFWLDRQTGVIQLVSRSASSPTVTASGSSNSPVISADGQWVVFASSATNHVTGQVDSNSLDDIFLWSAAGGAVTLVSHTSSSLVTTLTNGSANPVISADGARVAFSTPSTNVIAGFVDQNGTFNGDVYLYESATGNNQLVSFYTGFPTRSMYNNSLNPTISDDGVWVAFANRSNTTGNIQLFNRTAGTNVRISNDVANPSLAANGDSNLPTIAADGSRVAFQSKATNLVAGQVDGPTIDIFRYETSTGLVSLLSPAYGTTLTGSNAASSVDSTPSISADGTAVLFFSEATNLLANDYNFRDDVFIYDDP